MIEEVVGLEKDYPFIYTDGPVPVFFFDRDSGLYYLTHGPTNTPGVRQYPRLEGELTENIAEWYYNTVQATVFGMIVQAAGQHITVPLEALDSLPSEYPYTAYIAHLDENGIPRLIHSEITVLSILEGTGLLTLADELPFYTPLPDNEGYGDYAEQPYYLVIYDWPIKKLFTSDIFPDADELKIEMPGLNWSCRTHSYHLLVPLVAFAYANIGTDNWAKPLPYPETTVMDDCVPPVARGFETPHVFEDHMLHFDKYTNQWHSGGTEFWIPYCRTETQAKLCEVAFYDLIRRPKVWFYGKSYFVHRRNWT